LRKSILRSLVGNSEMNVSDYVNYVITWFCSFRNYEVHVITRGAVSSVRHTRKIRLLH